MQRLCLLVALSLLTKVAAYAQSTQAGAMPPYMHSETNRDAFARPVPALTSAQLRVFNFGNRLFNTNWVVAPASASGFDGLGPTFNRVSCSGCHLRDGRGRPPKDQETEFLSALLRISIDGEERKLGAMPVPGYGTQINDRAIPGVKPEARVLLSWKELTGQYADGTRYSLRAPELKIDQAQYGSLPKELRTSLRVAPFVFGLGLLESVDEAVIRAIADPDDRNNDGISGRVNLVWSDALQKTVLGRFGWKANVATLLDQNAGAANGDIGITSKLHPEQNCQTNQASCKQAIDGGKPELNDLFLEKLNAYVQMLGVPAPRARTAQIIAGEKLFGQMRCSACHLPSLTTNATAPFAFLQQQRFAPYTDLLLHDMGPGLADGRSDFLASGQEWRTAPLWGIGLIPNVNEHSFYLHDGRARDLTEAILWHGGEAQKSQQQFIQASKADRDALIAFLNSL